MIRKCVLTIGLLLIGTAAQAQDQGYVVGLGGMTFATETAQMFGVEVGAQVLHPRVVIFGEAGRMMNILPKRIQADLDDITEFFEFESDDNWEFQGEAPANYFGAGVKALFGSSDTGSFYVVGSAGVAAIKVTITEIDLGEIADELVDHGFLDGDDVKGNEFYFSLGAGYRRSLGAALLDVGYRLIRVNDTNISRVATGIGMRF